MSEATGQGTGAPLLEARGLTRRFGRVRALRGVDLRVEAGERVALVGPNGAGKSTLLRIVAGLVRPTAGSLLLDGRSGRAAAAGLRRRLGYVSHHTFLYDSLTARENLRFAGRLHGVAGLAERVATVLDDLGLAGRADEPVGTLSRGLQQRVALARALVHRPDLLLLDEPFTGLDRRAAQALHDLLVGTASTGRTVLLVTHDLARAVEIAGRAIVLVDGCVALDRSLGDAAARGAFDSEYAACLGAA